MSKSAAGGKLLFLTIDVDGCEQLRDNPAVDAYIVHIDTSTPELLRERIKQRLKVDESIVQRMLTEYANQLVLASPGLSDDAGEAEPEEGADEGAEPKEKPPITKRIVHPPQCAESFYKLLLIDDPNDLYYEFKVCCATLSPIVRNRLYGLPPHILDYSDVIPANKTEKVIVKPVILVGPNFLEKAELQRLIFEEFPEVFHRPQIVTTRPLRPDYPAEDDPAEFEDDGMIHVTKTSGPRWRGLGSSPPRGRTSTSTRRALTSTPLRRLRWTRRRRRGCCACATCRPRRWRTRSRKSTATRRWRSTSGRRRLRSTSAGFASTSPRLTETWRSG